MAAAAIGAVGERGRLVEVEPAAGAGGERRPAGEEKAFRPYDPEQVLLLAPVLSEWVPEGDLAHFVSDLVESEALDLSAIYAGYEEERGFPPYDPRLMVKLLVYGYANGVVSSRKLERASYRDVAVRMLCADQHPDYRSIARFRARHLQALGELFVQALRLCRQARLVGLGSLALDGTKLRANASRHKAMSYERMVKAEAQLEAEIAVIGANVRALLEEAAAVDAEEDERFGPDRRGDELPAELQRREQRLARIREAKQALEAEAAARESARRAELAAEGKQPRRPPNGRDPFKPKPRAQRNFTDPESKIMKTADGSPRRSSSSPTTWRRSAPSFPRTRRLPPTPATSPRTTSGSPASTGSTHTSPPAASSTLSRSRRRGAARCRRTRRRSSGWRAS